METNVINITIINPVMLFNLSWTIFWGLLSIASFFERPFIKSYAIISLLCATLGVVSIIACFL